MKIDRNLNLVFPVERAEGVAYVHCTPVGMLVFEHHFLAISKTFSALIENGGEWLLRMGPRVAKMMLKKVSETDRSWDEIERGFLVEIRRLTNVVMPLETGWTNIPLQEAVDKGYFSDEDLSEVENAVVFFTVCCASMKKKEANALTEAIAGLLDGQATSFNVTDFQRSLPTSTPEGNIGAKAKASSIPR